MLLSPPIRAKGFCLALFFLGGTLPALAQNAPAPSTQGVDLSGLSTVTRNIVRNYPVVKRPEVFIKNRYGTIRVTTWDNLLVRVNCEISVGALNAEQARAFAQSIDMDVTQMGDRIAIETVTPEDLGANNIGYAVHYTVTVPQDATVGLDNFFGDTYVEGVNGDTTLESRYGLVDLKDLGGMVRVRAKGEFPITVQGLQRGGVFILRSARALFQDVSGTLNVTNYLGSVEIRAPGEVVDIDIICENGPIHYYASDGPPPDLEVSAVNGGIESDFPLATRTWGASASARSTTHDSTQRVSLRTSFDSVYIHRDALETISSERGEVETSEPLTEEETLSYALAEGTTLTIDAIRGNVEIIGVDEDRVTITVRRLVQVASLSDGDRALAALALHVEQSDDAFRLRTMINDDLTALGCTDYRVDLTIRCPRTSSIRVYADDGVTSVRETGAHVLVEQARGKIEIEHAKGRLDLDNRDGGVDVTNCAGPVSVRGAYGQLKLTNVYGALEAQCISGKTIVDSAHSRVYVRNQGGDVRIIALEGIKGEYDISVEDGNISAVIPESADATLWINTRAGKVYSALPLNGTTQRDNHSYQVRLNEGTHRVLLETQRGDIILD